MPYYDDFYGSKWTPMTKEQKMVKRQLEEKYKAFGLGKIRLDNLVRSKIRKMFGRVY